MLIETNERPTDGDPIEHLRAFEEQICFQIGMAVLSGEDTCQLFELIGNAVEGRRSCRPQPAGCAGDGSQIMIPQVLVCAVPECLDRRFVFAIDVVWVEYRIAGFDQTAVRQQLPVVTGAMPGMANCAMLNYRMRRLLSSQLMAI